jgi:hypothetical protein
MVRRPSEAEIMEREMRKKPLVEPTDPENLPLGAPGSKLEPYERHFHRRRAK